MDVINKLYSSVQTTVSQLSGVLPGNNVTREYEVLHQVTNVGIGKHWKVYSGIKKTTRQEVSVFVFEKKTVEKWTKEDREYFMHLLRRGVQQLTKIKHPRILTVQHPLEESRDSLAFATEPVFASLSSILEETSISTKLFDVEIIHGFQQLIDGLIFLHSDANIIHGNLSPESILINKQRSWKIFGLDFCVTASCEADNFRSYKSLCNLPIHPSFEYIAPEKATNETNIPESDVYSLGMVMYYIFSGKPAIQFDNNQHANFRQFAAQFSQPKTPNMDKVPPGLQHVVKNMINPTPSKRPKLQELIQLQPFQDVGVKTLNYLDTLYQWDNLQKSKFYKGLLQIIPNFPHRVNLYTVIPYLVKEFMNLQMVPFVLPNILLIAKMSTQQEYAECILPHLKMVFKIDEPIQVLLILMQEMDVLLRLTPPEEIKLHLLPLFYRALEFEMTELQELCLQVLPFLPSLVDYNAIRNSILPRVKQLCLKSQNISIKVKCLICIGKLLEHLDKWVLISDVLPFLEHIKNREPAIIMAIIGIHRIALTDPKLGIAPEVMASKCIPFLMPFCMENSLSVAQFTSVTSIIKEMFQKVEKEQRIKLEQLNKINRDLSTTSNQTSVLQPTQNFSSTVLMEQKISLENETFGIFNTNKNTNPLVNQQLTSPTFEANFPTVNEDFICVNQPINYIYSMQSKSLENNPNKIRHLLNAESSSSKNKPEKTDLISLTHQDIINFLK